MLETRRLIAFLKKLLRQRHITYAQIAQQMDMSEANVKRLFASEKITLDRIESICRLMDMDLSDLFQLYEDSRQRISQLTVEQEKELIADKRVLFAAVCVRNHLSYEEILEHYNIAESELIQSLAKLDRLKIIDLLPNNRIKLRVAENFRWTSNGPIDKFYQQEIQKEFLNNAFDSEDNPRLFLSGLLSESSAQIIVNRLHALSNEFNQLHRQDSVLPLPKRKTTGLLLALREWEFSALQSYQK